MKINNEYLISINFKLKIKKQEKYNIVIKNSK